MIVAQVFLAIGYAALAWTDRPQPDGDSAEPGRKSLKWALLALVVVHAAVLWRVIFQANGVNLSFAASLSLIGLLLALALCASSWLLPMPGLASRSLAG